MNLIGQYDSPFVRRVALALRFYGIPFKQTPWSTFGDAEKIAVYNPLMRVPTLVVLDDGEVLIESNAILDHLDELAGPSRAMIPDCGHVRREVLHVCALATGLADKAVSLLYERVLRGEGIQTLGGTLPGFLISQACLPFSKANARRSRHAIGSATSSATPISQWPASSGSPAKLMPGLFDATRYPSLDSHAATCEALRPFQEIVQPLAPPN